MINGFEKILSKMAGQMTKSEIRELLKLTQKEGLISFAGGLPAPESFPVETVRDIAVSVLEEEGTSALQYGQTEGIIELREAIAHHYRTTGADVTVDNITITTSSQQALDFIGRVFIDRGDKIIVGLPSYLGGLQAFGNYGASFIGIPFDEDGMCPKELKESLETMKRIGEKPKFIYIIPDFQNPAGITMPESRRKKILSIARDYNVLIVEDSPYREIRFEGEHQQTFFELDNTNRVITLGTFSKIFAPGFRTGWVLAHPELLDKIITTKQSADLCTSPFNQKIIARYMKEGHFEKNLKKITKMYHEKRDAMLKAFEKYMPEGVSWTEPEGGLFLFVTLPEHIDTKEVFIKAVERNVAFVIGHIFHCDGSGKNTMRMNFSYVSRKQNIEGIKRLAETIKEFI